MAQKREKEETLELKVPPPSEKTPLSLSSSCPDNCKKIPSSSPSSRPEPGRVDPDPARPRSDQEQGKEAEPTAAVVVVVKERQEVAAVVGDVAVKKAVNRCSGCGKRVGLTGFRCRCGDLFCAEHRYSDRHDCGYDYKAAGREAIARENPVVRASKILKV